MRWASCLAVVVAGCYSPAPKAGIPCGTNGECPSGQHCDRTVDPPTCAAADARPPDAPPDAPPSCATNGDCNGSLPYCDLTTSYCRACRADVECGSTDVCSESEGTCHNANNALFIGPAGAGTACTRASPCTLATAIGQAANNSRVIVVLDGDYTTQFDVPGTWSSNTLTISGEDVDPAGALVAPANGAALLVAANSKPLVVEGITFQAPSGAGVNNRGTLTLAYVAVSSSAGNGVNSNMTATSIHIRDSVISGSGGVGVNVTSGSAEIERTHIRGNVSGGIDIQIPAFTIESSIIANNGSSVSLFGGAQFTNTDTASVFQFNTVANNTSATSDTGVLCGAPLVLDSSIVLDSVGAMCTPMFSLVAPTDPLFVGATDYHLQPSSPAIDMANPAATITTDIDGQNRPLGTSRDIGADEYGP